VELALGVGEALSGGVGEGVQVGSMRTRGVAVSGMAVGRAVSVGAVVGVEEQLTKKHKTTICTTIPISILCLVNLSVFIL
jgi:hypothetical protein